MNKKKLRTEGCKPATPTSIFRKWCVTAIILCFTMSVTAQTGGSNSTGVINGLDELTGKTFDELYKIAKETNKPSYNMEDPSKVFFLYNVETKQFLNSGSYWGTHVSLKHYGLPLWVDKAIKSTSGGITTYHEDRINFAQNLETGQGPYIAWIKGKSLDDRDTGCFIDRNDDNDDKKREATGWYFELTDGGKNTYRIYTKPLNGENDKKYYLHGNPDPFADKRCEADVEGTYDNKCDKWRVFSLAQLYKIQENNMNKMTESLELSFKLLCPSFSRGDLNIKNWQTVVWNKENTNAKQRYGLEHLYYTSNQITNDNNYKENAFKNNNFSYKFPEGETEEKEIKSKDDYERHLGKYFCADAKNTRGRIYQDIKVNNNGTYVIQCRAFSNTPEAKLFAEVVDKDGKVIENTLHTTVLWQISNMSEEQKTALHIKEQNMDYAGRNFYTSSQYTNSVLVLVSKESLDKGAKIRFGIQIGDNKEDTQIEDNAKEWTVFDDFRLLFAAKGTATDLILDEDAPNLSYLKDCSNTYQNAVLHLNKSFPKDKWTSIILPVNLTRKQIRAAFGANSRLAKLSTIKRTEIRFTTINMDKMVDENIALEAYVPYILYSTEVKKTSPAYQATLNKTEGGKTEQCYVRIKANHIDIPNVTFAIKDNKNDLSQMDVENWLTRASYEDATRQLTIHGTFARTFAPNSKQNEKYEWDFNNKDYGKGDKGTIITGRPDLKGCYFFDQGKMWYSESRQRGLRGFSCWIAPKNQGTATPANAKLFLDGIDMTGTTDIEDIFGGEEGNKVEKFANGIYNINGQLVRANSDSTEGLPEGLYIINGKKRFVKQQ